MAVPTFQVRDYRRTPRFPLHSRHVASIRCKLPLAPFVMFCSTRGASGFTFQHCLFRGLAEDGGMFMPQSIPVVTRDTLLGWRDLSFPDLAVEVLSLFVSDAEIPRVDLSSILHKSFTYVFAGGFALEASMALGVPAESLWQKTSCLSCPCPRRL